MTTIATHTTEPADSAGLYHWGYVDGMRSTVDIDRAPIAMDYYRGVHHGALLRGTVGAVVGACRDSGYNGGRFSYCDPSPHAEADTRRRRLHCRGDHPRAAGRPCSRTRGYQDSVAPT